jgi:hypothetical protein
MGLLARLRSSLTYPIAATLVLVTVVPVTLVGWLLASYNREHLTFVEKRFLSLEARGLAGEVSEFLESHRIQLQSTVRGLEAGGAIEVSGFEQLLQDIAGEQDRAFVYLQILDERGEGTFVRSPSLTAETESILTEAVAKVHAGKGFSNTAGGYEFNLLLMAAALGLLLSGPGTLSAHEVVERGLEGRGGWLRRARPRRSVRLAKLLK